MSTDSRPNEYDIAVGLNYVKEQHAAPQVSVQARRSAADRVVKLAWQYGVPVVEDAELASSLSSLHLREEIPEELFEPVAVLLSRLKGKHRL